MTEPCGIETDYSPLPLIHVASVALIDTDNRILVQKRQAGKNLAGLWEFPGGKLEMGEAPEQCLVRELQEELSITTWPTCLAPFTFASHRYDTFHLVMFLYLCRKWQGIVSGVEGQEMKWVMPQMLTALPMPAANASLTAMLRDLL
jgi:8-oxo-dGTP diphosphatase